LKDEPKPSFNQVPLFVSYTLTSDRVELCACGYAKLDSAAQHPHSGLGPFKIQPELTPVPLPPLNWICFHPSTFALGFAQMVSLRKAPFFLKCLRREYI